MQKLHVIPPLSLLSSSLKPIMQTKLSQILFDYLVAESHTGRRFAMVWCTVFPITKTFLFLKLFSASRTRPGDKTRCEFYVVLQVFNVAIEFFDEIEGKDVIAAIP